ncbi:MAG: hypothetical protein KBF92_02870, partial [Bacteroidia bacterium]|nr:hypothetical protein [Bacteroidia bacterium]
MKNGNSLSKSLLLFIKVKCMKRNLPIKKVLVTLIAFLLLVSGKVSASHTMGADLTYECLGGNTYKVTVSFYRDCIGIAAPANPLVTI